jgi:hypothetical protein
MGETSGLHQRSLLILPSGDRPCRERRCHSPVAFDTHAFCSSRFIQLKANLSPRRRGGHGLDANVRGLTINCAGVRLQLRIGVGVCGGSSHRWGRGGSTISVTPSEARCVLGAWRWGGDFVRPPGPWSMGTIGGIGVPRAMLPMLCSCGPRSGRFPRSSGRPLTGQDETTGARARKLHEASCRELLPLEGDVAGGRKENRAWYWTGRRGKKALSSSTPSGRTIKRTS